MSEATFYDWSSGVLETDDERLASQPDAKIIAYNAATGEVYKRIRSLEKMPDGKWIVETVPDPPAHVNGVLQANRVRVSLVVLPVRKGEP